MVKFLGVSFNEVITLSVLIEYINYLTVVKKTHRFQVESLAAEETAQLVP